MKSFATLALLTAVLSAFEPVSAANARRDSPVHDVIAARQYNPRSNKVNHLRTVVAPNPHKESKRETLTSAGTTVNKFLAVSGGQTGFVAYPLSGVGDYTITQDKTKAVVVRVTLGTTDVQNLPIVPQAGQTPPTYPYIGGMVGPSNPGYNSVPYAPSTSLDPNNYNYMYITNVANAPYGPASFGQSTDNSQAFIESGMFGLQSAAGTQLVPLWVNADGTVSTGQTFAADSAGNLLITANPGSTSGKLAGGISTLTINIVD